MTQNWQYKVVKSQRGLDGAHSDFRYAVRRQENGKWRYVSKNIRDHGRGWTDGSPEIGEIALFSGLGEARHVSTLMRGSGAGSGAGRDSEIIVTRAIALARLPGQHFADWWRTSEAVQVESAMIGRVEDDQ